jgi:ethanolamine ammonia-lyase small subunit
MYENVGIIRETCSKTANIQVFTIDALSNFAASVNKL